MEESMIEIDESTYEQLSDRSRSLEDKMNLVRCCCKLDPSYGRMKEKILEDLFFQTLNFCVEGGFSSSSARLLLKLVERELQYLERTSGAGGGPAEDGALRRFQERSAEAREQMPVATLKRMTGFYTQSFLRYADLYQYVLQQSPAEAQVGIELMVETPAVPIPLSS
jgi:hypothetical protein